MTFTDVEAVLFDMDGTLIEHTWTLQQLADALYAAFAGQLACASAQEFFEVYWDKSADVWHMMVDGALDGDLGRVYSFKNTLRALGCDTGLAEPMLHEWERLICQEIAPFADTFEVLQALRAHYKTGIITNGFRGLQRAKIARFRLDEYVDVTVVSEEVGNHKPDAAIFYQVLARLGHIPPERALFVGDTPESDIAGAQNAGLIPILMNPRDDIDSPGEGVLKIRALSELLDLLPKARQGAGVIS